MCEAKTVCPHGAPARRHNKPTLYGQWRAAQHQQAKLFQVDEGSALGPVARSQVVSQENAVQYGAVAAIFLAAGCAYCWRRVTPHAAPIIAA